MPTLEKFLTTAEEAEIIAAIRQAELKTSGEIRVHLEQDCKADVYKHALEVFHWLKMDNTKLQNSVLIYVAINKKQFVIYGDKGINNVVEANFWDSVKNHIEIQFKQGNFKQGIINGVLEAGKAMAEHFPWQHTDVDELPNTISKS